MRPFTRYRLRTLLLTFVGAAAVVAAFSAIYHEQLQERRVFAATRLQVADEPFLVVC